MSSPVKKDSRRRSQHSRGALCDPNMIWQSYRACIQRGEKARAFGNLYKYVELWVESTPSQSQSMRYRMDDSIVLSLAFDETGVEWLLKQRQNGVLSSLEDLATHLTNLLTTSDAAKEMGSTNELPPTVKQLAVLSQALSRIACCSENLPELRQSQLFDVMDNLCHACITAAATARTGIKLKLLLETITNSVAFLHVLLDPRHHWATTLSQHQPLHDEFHGSPVIIKDSVLGLFNLAFTQLSSVLGSRCADEYADLKVELLHLMGAILSGSDSNACVAITVKLDSLLVSLLEPRENCSDIQVLAIRVIIRMVHVLHCSISEELLDSVDARVLLSGLFNVLSPRWCDFKLVTPNPKLVISVLKSFSVLTHPPKKASELKEILVDIAVMEKVAEVLSTLKDEAKTSDISLGIELCCTTLRAFSYLLKGSPLSQEAFEQRVGYGRLMKHLTSLATPNKDVLSESLSIVIEDTFHEPVVDSVSICNPCMLAMLIRWIPKLPQSLQLWLANQIVDLCSTAVHNRQMCCSAGLLRVGIEVLADSQNKDNYIGTEVEDQLLTMIEVLASHSIMAAELKQLIGALRTTEDNFLPSYYYKMLQIMCTTAHRKEGIYPLYYFDLRSPRSHINVPHLQQWPNTSGFSFHAWVRLDHTSSLQSTEIEDVSVTPTKHRRVLYSFYSKAGSGFEAFFTETNNLVIATAVKKDFHTIFVREPLFRTSEWHSVCIVLQVYKKIVSRCEVTLYVDGEPVGSAILKAPGLADKTFRHVYIGSSHTVVDSIPTSPTAAASVDPPIMTTSVDGGVDSDAESEMSLFPHSSEPRLQEGTIPCRHADQVWGVSTHLGGLLSSVCVFMDVLTPASAKIIAQYGPNNLSLYQPKCSLTHDLASKLLFYYHPKACRNGECVDLSPYHVKEQRINGVFQGQPYVTWDIKDVLASIGGVELLFPILEQVHIPLKKFGRHGSSEVEKLRDVIDERGSTFHEEESVAAFLHLLVVMLDGSATNQNVFFLRNGPATIGALLQKVQPRLLTVQFLSEIQHLTELFTDCDKYLHLVMAHLLFNFHIWSRPELAVRIGHIQYITNIVHTNVIHCCNEFGVQFILDVIREFYSQMNCSVNGTSVDSSSLLDHEQLSRIRTALFDLLKLYIKEDVSKEEVEVINAFLISCQESKVLEELLQLLHSLLTDETCRSPLAVHLSNMGQPLLVFVQAENTSVRFLTIKIITLLVRSQNPNSMLCSSVHNGLLSAAVCQMAQHGVTSAIILALLELCTDKTRSNLTAYISNFSLFTAVLQLLRTAPLLVRHTVCQEVISLLHLNPEHIITIANHPGWESLFLWLLTKEEEVEETNCKQLKVEKKAAFVMVQKKEATEEEKGESPGCFAVNVEDDELLKIAVEKERKERGKKEDNQSNDEEEKLREDKEGEKEVKEKEKEKGLNNVFQDHPHRRRSGAMSRLEKKTTPETCNNSLSWSLDYCSDDDVWRTSAVVTETIGYILWQVVRMQEKDAWQLWGQVFASLEDFSSSHQLIQPVFLIKQRLFSLLMNAITLDIPEPSVSHHHLLETMLHVVQLFELFVVNSYPSFLLSYGGTLTASTEEIKSSSKHVDLKLDTRFCSTELLDHFLAMLNASDLLRTSCSEPNELSIIQSSVRILLACLENSDPDYYVVASTRLHTVVQSKCLPSHDIHFILYHLALILENTIIDNAAEDHIQHVAAAIRGVLSHCTQELPFIAQFPGLPDYTSPSFRTEIISYSSTDQWKKLVEDVLAKQAQEYNIVLFPWLSSCVQRRSQCLAAFQESEQSRKELVCTVQQTYQSKVLADFFGRREKELARHRSEDSRRRNELSTVLQEWRNTRRFFTGERGAWSSRTPETYMWKLCRTENFSNMRMKLTRLYNYTDHKDAARMRDLGTDAPVEIQKHQTADSTLLRQVTRTGAYEDDQDDPQFERLTETDSISVREEESKEEVVRTEKCDLIMLMEKIPGQLEITNKHIYFYPDQQERRELQLWYTPNFKMSLKELRAIHARRYNMARTAMEIFLVDQTNYFINFPTRKVVRAVYSSILSLRTPNLNRVGMHNPVRLLQDAKLTQKWMRGEMSNFDYLMQLNNLAGRSYNDLNQYPVFPWILRDYTSEDLDLTNPDTFRDLSHPMGIQNPKNIDSLVARYDELMDDDDMGKFHYGCHYSNAGNVLHFLMRLEPFTTLHVEFQSGRFDHADRQFFSIANTWNNILRSDATDVKELIPEFFYLPEFLTNCNGLDLGMRQDKLRVNDVVLPPWASTPEEFIEKHKEALESDYVSEHLDEWIDLIFGYKQTGSEAEKALNVFMKFSYEEKVNLDQIKDPKKRRQIESMINNFGQTPTRLFDEKHPKKFKPSQFSRPPSRGYLITGRKVHHSLLANLQLLKAHSIDISVGSGTSKSDAVVFVGTPTIQTRALLVSGNPEQMVTITSSGHMNVHGWLPVSSSKNRPFSFQFDPTAHFDKSRWQYVGAPFAHDMAVNPKLFILSPNNKVLVTGGHWDNSFRVFSVDRGKLTARNTHHNDVVTCMALDKAGTGEHLITGSRDTTCVIWQFTNNEVSEQPRVTLYGHDSEVLCVDISTELDMAVSGAKDGTCIIHTVCSGQYMYTLRPRPNHQSEIRHTTISSSHGRIVVYSQGPSGRSRPICAPPCIHLYSINGKLLQEKELAEPLNDLVVIDHFIITGNAKGFLTFRDLFTLRQQSSLNLLQPVRCISVVLDHQRKVCTHLLVGLENGKLIIVSNKEIFS